MAHARKVVRSVNAPGGAVCVDVFACPDGRFGYELYRRDPEDPRGWGAPAGFGARRFPTAEAALADARDVVPWLAEALDEKG
jgi:hypothetical protein